MALEIAIAVKKTLIIEIMKQTEYEKRIQKEYTKYYNDSRS